MSFISFQNDFLDLVESYTERKLHHKFFLQQLIDETNNYKLYDTFEDLAFTGKYVNGLLRAVKIGQSNPDITNLQMIKKDLMKNIEKVISLIKEITANLSAEQMNEINVKFIELSREQFTNLTQLIDDLDQVKKYLNHLKRVEN